MAICKVVIIDDDPALRARVRSCLSREGFRVSEGPAGDLIIGELRADSPQLIVDAERRRVAIRGGAEVALTRQEFDLLHLLSCRPGIVFGRQALIARLPRTQSGVTERTIDAIVARLRQKLGDDSRHPRFIFTVWGTGYKFADAAER